jgi:putative transposase
MRDLVILFLHVIATLARLLGPGGIRSVVAESVLIKQQLLILNRSRQRAPNLRSSDRLVAGLCALLIRPARLIRSAIVLKPSTLLSLHQALRNRKYQLLFSPKRTRKPGPKGPSRELIEAVVETKQRNPTWGCPRIAQQIALAFNIPIDKDVVRRILASHYRPDQDSTGPSWLTFIGHLKDSLWSLDLFRCESATLRTHSVLVVMDQYTRRIIGFGIHAGVVDGIALCRMFNHAIRGHWPTPKYLSSDHDPLYRFEQWEANLRILDVAEIKTVPYVPLSSSVRGAADWNGSKGVFESHVILDYCRSRKQAAGVPGLLQQFSHASLIGGKNTRQDGTTTGRVDVLSMAIALSRLVPDTDRCVIVGRLRCRSGSVKVNRLETGRCLSL